MDATNDIVAGERGLPLKQHIDGRWVDAIERQTFDVCNPADGSLLRHVPASTGADARRAIDAASRAFGAWSQSPAAERTGLLRRIAEQLRERSDALARLIAHRRRQADHRIPRRSELRRGFLRFFARIESQPVIRNDRVARAEQAPGDDHAADRRGGVDHDLEFPSGRHHAPGRGGAGGGVHGRRQAGRADTL